jgi:hypothetical protein
MTFRFQIAEARKARRPIVVLIGTVLEGSVRVGDPVSVPLADGARFVGAVAGVLHGWPDTAMHSSASADEQGRTIGLGVRRPDRHQADDIASGIVTSA